MRWIVTQDKEENTILSRLSGEFGVFLPLICPEKNIVFHLHSTKELTFTRKMYYQNLIFLILY